MLITSYMVQVLPLVDVYHSDEHGDRPRPLPVVPELKKAFQLTERKESPHWDFDVSFFSCDELCH